MRTLRILNFEKERDGATTMRDVVIIPRLDGLAQLEAVAVGSPR